MNNFDKDNLFYSVVTGFLLSSMLLIILWILRYVWTFSPTSVVALIVLIPTISYIVYVSTDSF